MTLYQVLVDDLRKLRANVTSFRRVALHCHSPGSYDFQSSTLRDKTMGSDTTGKITQESLFIELLNKTGLDMVALTDHMKCGCSCRISASPLCNNICVLPGMEVSIRPLPPWNAFRLHVLVIFPKGFSLEQICKVLPPIADENKRDGKECIDTDLPKFIAGVKTHGGIVIAAHVDSERGVRRAFRQLGREGITLYDPKSEVTEEDEKQISTTFKDWILTAGFDAIEVATEADKQHYRWISKVADKEVSIPVLLSNDAHCIDDITLADKITHVKMASIGFDGLKQALQFPDTRIRFPSDVPMTPSPRILGLEIIAGDEKGFFNELKIAFSDNLTCLIGPRGSGKSTIIEALRYVIGYNRSLQEIEFPTAELATKVRSLQEATLSKCVIRLAYCRNGNIDILEAAYDPKQDYATKVYTLDGEIKEIADIEASGIYPLRLFGWGELETLGREASRQRDLIDRMIPQLGERLENRNILRSQLTAKRKEIESSVSKLGSIMSKNSGEIRRYQEYKSDFDKLNTEDVKSLFAALDNAKAKVGVLTKVQHNIKEWISTIEKFSAPDLTQGIEQLTKNSPEIRDWWDQKREEIRLTSRQSEAKSEIDKGLVIIKNLLKEIDGYLKELSEEIQQKDKAIRDKVSIEAAKQVMAELRRTASQRLGRVTGLQHDYSDEWKKLEGHLKQWAKIAKELSDLHDDIRGKRTMRKAEIEASLNKYSTPQMKISLQFLPGLDRTEFRTYLRDSGILSRDFHGHYKASGWPEKIALVCTPIELAEAILAKDPQQLIRKMKLPDGREFEVDETMANTLVESLYPFGEDTDANIPIVDEQKLNKVLSVAEVKWDDLERVMLNDRPVEKVSPGQRCSAMLPLIALVEKAPLVIDQPEDNLDNRLVGKMLVDILAALKEHRQIIVATHNPNIVVSGDAEQVIVLDALSDSKGKCTQSGSIDEEGIIQSVIDIMEGGKEAFELRRKRYQYTL